MKTCTQCGELKACSEYSVRRASRDGLTPACKTCVKAQQAEYYKANADRIKAQQAEYYKANVDQRKAQKAEYYKANADRIKAQQAEYYKANVDQRKAQKAEYYKANADRIKAYRATNVDRIRAQQADYRKANADQRKAYQAEYRAENPHTGWESDYRIRARKFGLAPVVESFTREEMIAFWNNGEQCIYCDGPFQEIDHVIPVGLGGHHVISNVAPSCTPCNRVNIWAVRTTRTASPTND